MNSILSISDFDEKDKIIRLLNFADDIKKNPEKYFKALENYTIILIFEKTSTRTRISFESGIYQLGGNAIYLDWRTANFHLGDLKDEIKCISRYVNLIIARVYKHQTLEFMRDVSNIPVINALSDNYHPCQILSDLMTIREHFGGLEGIKVAFIGDGNNVCNSLIIGCTFLNIPITVATPKKYRPHQEVLDWVKSQNLDDYLKLTENPVDAVKDADVIYTDTFVSMGQEAEAEERLKVFKPYQVNSELLSNCEKDYIIMHCLPAHRGVEITDEVLDSKNSIVFDQAENRLHLQKALMLSILKEDFQF
ncbi:MAG: ornithine carbamoyltransferase [Promethearchaeia archaeon]